MPPASTPARSAPKPGTPGTSRSKNPTSQARSQRHQKTIRRCLTTSSYAGVNPNWPHSSTANKSAKTIRTYTEAVQWFAASRLQQDSRDTWEQVDRRHTTAAMHKSSDQPRSGELG
jgi:hypothetical protein